MYLFDISEKVCFKITKVSPQDKRILIKVIFNRTNAIWKKEMVFLCVELGSRRL